MNALTPHRPNVQLAKTTSSEVSASAWRLLVHEPTADLCVDEVLRCPALHDEIRAAYPALAAHAAPCGAQTVVRAIGKLFAIFPQPDRSDAEWAAFWEAYREDLGEIPAEALASAIREYRQSGKAEFLPKPGPLREIALRHAEPIFKASHRAKRIAESLPRPDVAPEELERRRQVAAEVLASLGVRAPE